MYGIYTIYKHILYRKEFLCNFYENACMYYVYKTIEVSISTVPLFS